MGAFDGLNLYQNTYTYHEEKIVKTKPFYYLTFLHDTKHPWGCDDNLSFDCKEEALKVYEEKEKLYLFPMLVYVNEYRGREDIKRQYRTEKTIPQFEKLYCGDSNRNFQFV